MQPITCARPLPGRRTALAALLAALLLAGCGGSGSSGFDALAAENAAIDRALATMDCTVEQGLTICASTLVETPAAATPTPTRTPTALHTPGTNASPTRTVEAEPSRTATGAADRTGTPTPTPSRTATRAAPSGPAAELDVAGADGAACADLDLTQPCVLLVRYAVTDVPPGSVSRVVARERDPDSPWRVEPDDGGQALVGVPAGVGRVQIAILTFYADPGPLPEAFELLADSGADLAFVSAPLAVRDGD